MQTKHLTQSTLTGEIARYGLVVVVGTVFARTPRGRWGEAGRAGVRL